MARRSQPPATGNTIYTTTFIPRGVHHGSNSHSKGFWIGVAFFVIIILSLVLRSSYLANTYWFRRLRAGLGLHPRDRPPIVYGPRCDWRFTTIKRPEPAYVGWSSSDTLPLYQPTSNFSSEILQALKDFGLRSGERPPSYRSRLTWDLEASMTESSARRSQKPTLQPSAKQIEMDRRKG